MAADKSQRIDRTGYTDFFFLGLFNWCGAGTCLSTQERGVGVRAIIAQCLLHYVEPIWIVLRLNGVFGFVCSFFLIFMADPRLRTQIDILYSCKVIQRSHNESTQMIGLLGWRDAGSA